MTPLSVHLLNTTPARPKRSRVARWAWECAVSLVVIAAVVWGALYFGMRVS